MDSIFLSIIVPVYNVEKYLRQCLDSILNIRSVSYEIILIVGNSSDSSNQICEEYQKSYPCISLIYQTGSGLSNARNCGFRVAVGKYIMYADSDDYIVTGAFERTMQKLYALPTAAEPDVLISDFFLVNQNDVVYDERRQIIVSEEILDAVVHLENFLRTRQDYWNVWRAVYRRQFLLKENITFMENVKSEDIDYSTSVLLRAERAAFYHNPYYCYRVRRSGSLVNTIALKNIEDLLMVLEKNINKVCSDESFPYKKDILKKFQWEYFWSFVLVNELDDDEKKAAIRTLKKNLGILKSTNLSPVIYYSIKIVSIGIWAKGLKYLRDLRRWKKGMT